MVNPLFSWSMRTGRLKRRKVEIGLDNNRKVQILSGLKEGEFVSLTPPLQEATVDSKSEMEEERRIRFQRNPAANRAEPS